MENDFFDLRVLDGEQKGNSILLYLGTQNIADKNEFYGDDWDDSPWDCNAGPVYEEFVVGTLVLHFLWDTEVLDRPEDYIDIPNTYKERYIWL